MTAPALLAAWGIAAIGSTILAGILASLKHRDIGAWMAWAFLLPPTLLFLAFLPKIAGPPAHRSRRVQHHDDHFL